MQTALGVQHLHGHEGYVAPVRADGVAVHGKGDGGRVAGGRNLSFQGDLSTLHPDRLESAWLVGHIPGGFAIEKQLDAIAIGVARDWQEHTLAAFPVPVREEVQHRLPAPLALVEVVAVLGETATVDDAGTGSSGCAEGFAEVIDAGPHEVAGDVIVGAHEPPKLLRIQCEPAHAASASASRRRRGRQSRGFRRGWGNNAGIVAALPAHPAAFGSDHAPVGMGGLVEAIVQNLQAVVGELVGDFIAATPQHHGRMIAVAVDEIGDIALVPLVEDPGIAVAAHLSLAGFPFVEGLVHDQKAHAVAEVQELGRRRIVAGSDSIAAHLAQGLETPLPNPLRHGRAHGAGVVVQANSVQFDVLAIQQEPAVGVEDRLADADGGLVLVHRLLAHPDRAAHFIKIRGGHAPERGFFDGERLPELVFGVGADFPG